MTPGVYGVSRCHGTFRKNVSAETPPIHIDAVAREDASTCTVTPHTPISLEPNYRCYRVSRQGVTAEKRPCDPVTLTRVKCGGQSSAMDATRRSDPVSDAGSVGSAARSGDRAALRALGSIGGKRAAERAAARKATTAADVHLSTVSEMRTFVTQLAGELKAANLDEARKATAGAALIRALAELDGFSELVRERDALRTEVAMLRAGHAVTDRTFTTSLGDAPEPDATGPSPGTPHSDSATNTGESR